MRFFAMLLTLVLSSSVLHAAVVEEKLTLPNGLGTAVLYHDSAVTKAAPAVVVVHEWWGLNDYARERAKQLAELGYTAIAAPVSRPLTLKTRRRL